MLRKEREKKDTSYFFLFCGATCGGNSRIDIMATTLCLSVLHTQSTRNNGGPSLHPPPTSLPQKEKEEEEEEKKKTPH